MAGTVQDVCNALSCNYHLILEDLEASKASPVAALGSILVRECGSATPSSSSID
jgi:hypothetical protein